jgi:hypothetical protein
MFYRHAVAASTLALLFAGCSSNAGQSSVPSVTPPLAQTIVTKSVTSVSASNTSSVSNTGWQTFNPYPNLGTYNGSQVYVSTLATFSGTTLTSIEQLDVQMMGNGRNGGLGLNGGGGMNDDSIEFDASGRPLRYAENMGSQYSANFIYDQNGNSSGVVCSGNYGLEDGIRVATIDSKGNVTPSIGSQPCSPPGLTGTGSFFNVNQSNLGKFLYSLEHGESVFWQKMANSNVNTGGFLGEFQNLQNLSGRVSVEMNLRNRK